MDKKKPIVFIGSSSESLNIAKTLNRQLEGVAIIELWTDVFHLGETTIEGLFRQLNRSDYAILVVTGDDLVKSRSNTMLAPRDNIIFELGLFMSRLGRRRTFILCDKVARPKLPSDLEGIIYKTFDSAASVLEEVLEPVSRELIKSITRRKYATEVDFLRAFLTIIHNEIELSSTYADILNDHLKTLISEIERLKYDSEWHRLIEVKERMREFFEYSGMYKYGAKIGEDYVLALQELGKHDEALWSLVKDVAYMLILADDYDKGRKMLQKAINNSEKELDSLSRLKFLFYAYRYMGISYMREEPPDFELTEHYFKQAGMQVDVLKGHAIKIDEMQARLERNLGNLELERKNIAEALHHYQKSLILFKDIKDQEHIGISHLVIGKALIKQGNLSRDTNYHLAEAQRIFARIGWIEGQGRVFEQYSLLAQKKAEKERKGEKKEHYLEMAVEHAQNAKAFFDRIQNLHMKGRISNLIEQQREMLDQLKNKRSAKQGSVAYPTG